MDLQIVSFFLALLSGVAGVSMFWVYDWADKKSSATKKRCNKLISFLNLFVIIAFFTAIVCGYFAVVGEDYGWLKSLLTTAICGVLAMAIGVLFMHPKEVFRNINETCLSIFWNKNNKLPFFMAKLLSWCIIISFVMMLCICWCHVLWMISVVIASIATLLMTIVMIIPLMVIYLISLLIDLLISLAHRRQNKN